jgi:hypothetical protein
VYNRSIIENLPLRISTEAEKKHNASRRGMKRRPLPKTGLLLVFRFVPCTSMVISSNVARSSADIHSRRGACMRGQGGSKAPVYPEVPRGAPGYTEVTPGYPEVPRGTPRCPRGIPGHPEVPRGTPRYPAVPRGAPKCPRVSRGTPEYPGVSRGTPGSTARLRAAHVPDTDIHRRGTMPGLGFWLKCHGGTMQGHGA